MAPSRYGELFLSESQEHIARMNRVLLVLEADARDASAVEELFRSVHTVKGMSAAMGCDRSAEVAHALEQLLEPVRAAALVLDGEIVEALFQAVDALERTIQAEVGGEAGERVDDLVHRLGELAGAGEETMDAGGEPVARPVGAEAEAEGGIRATVMIAPTASLPAVRAVLVLRRARELGRVEEVQPTEDRLAVGDFPGSLRFRLFTDRELDEVRAALLGAGEVAHLELEEVGVETGGGTPTEGAAEGRGGEALVRIPQQRLDALLDQIGEMVIARDRLERVALRRAEPELSEVADHLSRLVGALRDEVMQIRMAPVGEALERFPRLVRDAARALGRRVSLTVEGADVRLDRSLLNELADLLVHLLRNAVDHGIESPEERRAAGKPEVGEIRIRATRRWSQVVVEVRDDGAGIRRDRVLAQAAERGWVPRDRVEPLSDAELRELITRPGLSTAEQVTDLSGRGVGLDVVSSRIQALGGTLQLASEAGRGSVFTVGLPMTLSIVRSLLVEAGGETFAIPIRSVVEVAEVATTETAGGEWLRPLGERIPLHPLHQVAGAGPAGAAGGWHPVVVVEGTEGPAGLLVDRLVGQVEAVLKPFDAPRGVFPVFSGSTLLPDGRIALILDVPRLSVWLAGRAECSTTDTVC